MVVFLNLLMVCQLGLAFFSEAEFQPQLTHSQVGRELTLGLRPFHAGTEQLFASFIDTEGVEHSIEPPQNRTGVGRLADIKQMLGLRILVERGDISAGTLIISDTGHDITTAAYFMREFYDRFTIQSAFYFPQAVYQKKGIYGRVLSQLQTWGEELAFWQRQHAEKGRPDIIFLGLEGHRKDHQGRFRYQIPWQTLPTALELEAVGIKKVIFLTEAHPDATQEQKRRLLREDTAAYLESLGMPVEYMGNDCRRDHLCWDLIGRKNPYGKFSLY